MVLVSQITDKVMVMAKTVNIDPGDIIKAAIDCIQEKGVSSTTLKDVAARTRVTQGTVYYYFKTKEALMAAVIDHAVSKNYEALERALDAPGDVYSKVESVMDAARDLYGRDEGFYRLFFNVVAMALHNEKAAGELAVSGEKALRMVEELAKKVLSQNNSTAANPEYIARIIMAVVVGLALQSMNNKDMNINGVYETFKLMLKNMISQK